MAQNVTIAGAAFSAVPAIEVPKTGGGIATFSDPSGTTATASDVAQGKLFLDASGVLTTGTASGGGSFTPILGVIRPDAELVQKWTYDKKYVADLGNSIPAYSTSSKSLVNSSSTSVDISPDVYTYFVCYRVLGIPIYNSSTIVSGRGEYSFLFQSAEAIHLPSSVIKSFNGGAYTSEVNFAVASNLQLRYVYWSRATKLAQTTSGYGVFCSGLGVPSVVSTKITVSFPSFSIKGNATYFPQAVWNTLTDLRMQYVAELYRVPRSSETDKDGWWGNTQIRHILNCVDNGGTLT